MIYFLCSNSSNLPHIKSLQTDITIIDGLSLCSLENEQDLKYLSNQAIYVLDEETVKGLQLINNNQLLNEKGETRDYTKKELSYINKAQKVLKKLSIRTDITLQIGDIPDLLADLCKRVSVLEYILMYIAKNISSLDEIPDDVRDKITSISSLYINGLENNTIETRVSIDDIEELYDKVLNRITQLNTLVKDKYLK